MRSVKLSNWRSVLLITPMKKKRSLTGWYDLNLTADISTQLNLWYFQMNLDGGWVVSVGRKDCFHTITWKKSNNRKIILITYTWNWTYMGSLCNPKDFCNRKTHKNSVAEYRAVFWSDSGWLGWWSSDERQMRLSKKLMKFSFDSLSFANFSS